MAVCRGQRTRNLHVHPHRRPRRHKDGWHNYEFDFEGGDVVTLRSTHQDSGPSNERSRTVHPRGIDLTKVEFVACGPANFTGFEEDVVVVEELPARPYANCACGLQENGDVRNANQRLP